MSPVDPAALSESAEELFEHAPCGFLLAAADGLLLRANQTFFGWTGHSPEWIAAGRRLTDVLTVAGRIFYETHYAPLLRLQGAIREIALDLQRPGREPLPVLLTSVRQPEIAGRPALVRTTLFDATDRRKYERELLRERRRAEYLASVIRSSDEPIVILSPDGRIETWNRGAETTFGYRAGEAVGRTMAELIVPAAAGGEHAEVLHELQAGRPVKRETVYRTKAGRAVDVALSFAPHFDDGGNLLASAAVLQDITVRKQIDEQLRVIAVAERTAREQAERAAMIKDEFLATLSHELRTPLNAVLGWTQLLLQLPPGSPEFAAGLEVIDRNGRAQAQLVEDLLDMSRITSGKLRLDVRPTELAAVVAAAVDTALPALQAKNIRVQSVLDPAVRVSGDPGRLQQVFWNLLHNAIKFTHKGGLIRVTLQRINSQVEVSIADNGQGMTPEFLAVAFERFRQADAASARTTTGLGLGLAIVKNLVEMHGGSILATSDGAGRGSTFTVSLPALAIYDEHAAKRVHPRAGASATRVIPGARVSLAGAKVLIVEDEPDAREMVRRALAEQHADVQTASSAAEAFDLLSRFRPDVLISDVGLPDEDGYALIARVRRIGPIDGGSVPAIALTAFARTEDRTRSLLAGFDAHLAKPVDLQELIAAVGHLAKRLHPR